MPPYGRAAFVGFYALVALLAGGEVAILGLALNPQVHPDYRAFYIAETTTCLNRDRIGTGDPDLLMTGTKLVLR